MARAKSKATSTEKIPREALKPDFSAVESYEPTGGENGAAFFDFDKTLLHGDAGVIYARQMAKWAYGVGKELTPVGRAAFYAYLTGRMGSMMAREVFFRTLYSVKIIKRSRLVELGYNMLNGVPTTYIDDHLERVWDEVLAERFYPQMLAIINRHRELGQKVVIVSTGLQDILEHAKHYVGDDVDVIACTMHVEEGFFTGKVTGPLYGAHKATAVREYAREHDIDLEESYAYSDHYSDEAFLDAVGHPVAINPGKALRRLAMQRGWTILDLPPPHKGGNDVGKTTG